MVRGLDRDPHAVLPNFRYAYYANKNAYNKHRRNGKRYDDRSKKKQLGWRSSGGHLSVASVRDDVYATPKIDDRPQESHATLSTWSNVAISRRLHVSYASRFLRVFSWSR